MQDLNVDISHLQNNVENNFDLEQVAQCQTISGTLRMERNIWVTQLDLPCLTTVNSALIVDRNPALITMAVPNLNLVGGLTISSNLSLGSIDLNRVSFFHTEFCSEGPA